VFFPLLLLFPAKIISHSAYLVILMLLVLFSAKNEISSD
jgi:hypothetical protein